MKKQKQIISISVIIGIVLMIVKFVAFMITGSNAILTDAAESIVNVLASGFAFYSIYLSAKPKDENHPYGHGKVEFFSVFLEGGLIFIAGILILSKAIYSIFSPEPVENLMQGIGLIAITGVINFVYGSYMVKQSKRLNSLTLLGDGKHLQTDAYSTVGLTAGLLLMYWTGYQWLDTIMSAGLGIFIIWNGYRLVRKSISGLMDESDLELIENIVNILNTERQVDWIDIHNLRVQRYGPDLHVDCHVTLPSYYHLIQVHDVISLIDEQVNKYQTSRTELFIHADPCIPNCCHYCQVPACPIRSEEFQKKIEWSTQNVIKNAKHFESAPNIEN